MHQENAQHYTSDSVWRDPSAFLADFLRDLRQSPELARQLFLRNIRARYRQSLTGYVWAFVPPLAWTGLFLFLHSANSVNGTEPDLENAARIVVGVVFWQVFIDSVQTPMRSFAEARSLLGKIKFPRESLILAGLLDIGLQFLIRLPLLVAAWFLIPGAGAQNWWLLPLILVGLVAVGSCVGLLMLPLSLLYQDVAPAIALASGFWLLITPVGYSAPSHGLAATLTAWNPASSLISTARTGWVGDPLTDLAAFVAIVAAGLVLALCGWLAARVAFPHLIARFGT